MSAITFTIANGHNCEACGSNDETVSASYKVESVYLRTLSIYAPTAYLCDSHLDILHEKVDD